MGVQKTAFWTLLFQTMVDMRFYWIQDRIKQGHFRVCWRPGFENLADYFTKHHAPIHHRRMRPIYLSTRHERQDPHGQPRLLRGCAGLTPQQGGRTDQQASLTNDSSYSRYPTSLTAS